MAALDSPLYLVIKLVAYCVWCFVGLRLLHSGASFVPLRALGFGVLRLFMGFFFGITIYFLGSLSLSALGSGLPQNVITYLLVYIPVRWIEWSIMSGLLSRNSSAGSSWFFGWTPPDRY